jgi:hypothetical protein
MKHLAFTASKIQYSLPLQYQFDKISQPYLIEETDATLTMQRLS